MKLPCPLCGENIVYQAEKAGSTIPCTYCKQPLRMPAPDEPDPESYREYALERKREEERQARQKQKEQARRQREQEARRQVELREAEAKREAARREAEAKREAEEHRRREQAEEAEGTKLQQPAARLEGPQDLAPEESAPHPEYPGMRTISGLYQAAAVIGGFLAIIAFVVGIGMASDADSAVPFVLGCVATAAFLFQALVSWAVAESIVMALDMAHDLRSIRYLLKRLPPRVDSTEGES